MRTKFIEIEYRKYDITYHKDKVINPYTAELSKKSHKAIINANEIRAIKKGETYTSIYLTHDNECYECINPNYGELKKLLTVLIEYKL